MLGERVGMRGRGCNLKETCGSFFVYIKSKLIFCCFVVVRYVGDMSCHVKVLEDGDG